MKKPVLPLIILLIVFVVGTIGYKILWIDKQATIMDALFMTFTTITTIGYGEVYPLDSTARIFTMIISTAGIGSMFYLLSIFMENLFILQNSNLRGIKKMHKTINSLKNHTIVVGYGRVGRIVSKELKSRGEKFIVIEHSKENQEEFDDKEMILIHGDATDDEVLVTAGIDRARALIIATGNSAINVFVVLSAREMNKDLFIVARGDDDQLAKKLVKAGADRVINTYSTGGEKLANVAVNPHVMDFIDSNLSAGGKKLKIEQYKIQNEQNIINKSLRELDIRKHSGVSVIGIIRDEDVNLSPSADSIIIENDILIILGTNEQLENFNNFMGI